MALIREDTVSPYIIFNGSIIRPIAAYYTINDFPYVQKGPMYVSGSWKHVVGRTKLEVGSKVNAKMIQHSPYYNVGGEVWTSHGNSHWWDKEELKSKAFDSKSRHLKGQEYHPSYNDPLIVI